MSKELEGKRKTALDESRLLILGAQVLFGFAFQAAFQELFAEVDSAGRTMQILALGLLSLSVALLIVPPCITRSPAAVAHSTRRSAWRPYSPAGAFFR
jgi:Family of unknown function (DUF6328)